MDDPMFPAGPGWEELWHDIANHYAGIRRNMFGPIRGRAHEGAMHGENDHRWGAMLDHHEPTHVIPKLAPHLAKYFNKRISDSNKEVSNREWVRAQRKKRMPDDPAIRYGKVHEGNFPKGPIPRIGGSAGHEQDAADSYRDAIRRMEHKKNMPFRRGLRRHPRAPTSYGYRKRRRTSWRYKRPTRRYGRYRRRRRYRRRYY